MRSHFCILTHCPHATACYLVSLLINIHGLIRPGLLLLGMPWLLRGLPLAGHSLLGMPWLLLLGLPRLLWGLPLAGQTLLGSPWLTGGVSLCLWGFGKGQHSCVVSLEGQLGVPTSYAVDMHTGRERFLSRHTVKDTIQPHTDGCGRTGVSSLVAKDRQDVAMEN